MAVERVGFVDPVGEIVFGAPAETPKVRMNDRMAELLRGYPVDLSKYELTSRAAAVFGLGVRGGAIASADVADGGKAQLKAHQPGLKGNGKA